MENFDVLYNEFKKDFIKECPELTLNYKYIEDDYYSIYHNRKYESRKFLSFVGVLLTKYFFDHDIYNIAFSNRE